MKKREERFKMAEKWNKSERRKERERQKKRFGYNDISTCVGYKSYISNSCNELIDR